VPMDGSAPTGVNAIAKRGVALNMPKWEASTCVQCNVCATACPHAVIRPFILTKAENDAKPESLVTLPNKNKDIKAAVGESFFAIQVSPHDCTGCSVCVNVCPTNKKGTLTMVPYVENEEQWEAQWNYLRALPNKGDLLVNDDIKLPKNLAFRQ
ncbi:hypothetical protein KIPB_017149, partial [Kipferlia bialata]